MYATPAIQTVGRAQLDELLMGAALALRGEDDRPVLEEAPGIDEVVDVLTRRAVADGVSLTSAMSGRMPSRATSAACSCVTASWAIGSKKTTGRLHRLARGANYEPDDPSGLRHDHMLPSSWPR
jgi:hypothetical protein